MSFLIMVLIVLLAATDRVMASGVEIFVDDTRIEIAEDMGAAYIDSNNRLMVPLRLISEKLGHRVEWIQDIKTIAIDKDIYISIEDKGINTFIEGDEIFIKSLGKAIEMDAKANLKDNRSYVPVRYIVEALGHEIEYENNNNLHRINILKNKGKLGRTTTQGRELYYGHMEQIKENEITIKKAYMLFDDDIKIFPELKLTEDDFPGGYYMARTDKLASFEITDATIYKLIDWSEIGQKNVSKAEFLYVFNNNKFYTNYFFIESKNGKIDTISEVYHP